VTAPTIAVDPVQPVQAGLYARLTGDATLMGMVAGVHDQPPEEAALDYVVIRDLTAPTAAMAGKSPPRCTHGPAPEATQPATLSVAGCTACCTSSMPHWMLWWPDIGCISCGTSSTRV
jgi:hypothetical protein